MLIYIRGGFNYVQYYYTYLSPFTPNFGTTKSTLFSILYTKLTIHLHRHDINLMYNNVALMFTVCLPCNRSDAQSVQQTMTYIYRSILPQSNTQQGIIETSEPVNSRSYRYNVR